MARNEWFQSRALAALQRFRDRHADGRYVLFSYSYAAARLFEFAKQSGWTTVLGQMDPGPFEEKIVMDLHRQAGCAGAANPAPAAYWERWRKECRLADRIIVNSDWSRQGLRAEGVPSEKLHVVPLGYDRPAEAANFARTYPAVFDSERPLRVLFLGQANVRKGVLEILGAVSKLEKLPVEFWIVGDAQVPLAREYERHPRVKWFGTVSRSATANFYRDADVFLFPTFSDGFGITQLEAQAWSLPVIASQRCGDVVEHGINGFLLPDVTADAIAGTLESILAAPGMLRDLAAHSRVTEFTLDKLYDRIQRMSMDTDLCCRS
ncbi:MAG: glycosyltransferase family 4 protein [Bryobacteraceae bacterium]|jgi:glycosyltransferase involved in cell wall biosynthesis